MRICTGLVLLACLCGVGSASAQSVTAVPVSREFVILWDYTDPRPAEGFRVYVDSALVGTVAPTAREFLIPGQPAGRYDVRIAAFTEGGEVLSDPLPVQVADPAPLPGKPTNLRIELRVTVAVQVP
jgi:hypothetical protein